LANDFVLLVGQLWSIGCASVWFPEGSEGNAADSAAVGDALALVELGPHPVITNSGSNRATNINPARLVNSRPLL
jgi:hypothetical protein